MRLKSSRSLLFCLWLTALTLTFARPTAPPAQCNGCPELKTKELDLKGCIHLYSLNRAVIKDEATMKSLVRNDLDRKKCLASLNEINFSQHTLVGIELNTGWCEGPIFTYRVVRDDAKKRYLLSVLYFPPDEPCRARSQYDLWVLVPKLPEQYEVEFDVKARARGSN